MVFCQSTSWDSVPPGFCLLLRLSLATLCPESCLYIMCCPWQQIISHWTVLELTCVLSELVEWDIFLNLYFSISFRDLKHSYLDWDIYMGITDSFTAWCQDSFPCFPLSRWGMWLWLQLTMLFSKEVARASSLMSAAFVMLECTFRHSQLQK